MIFHENRLPADDSHEIPCLICLQNFKLSSAAATIYAIYFAVTVQGSYKLFACIKIDPHDEEILYLVPISIYAFLYTCSVFQEIICKF